MLTHIVFIRLENNYSQNEKKQILNRISLMLNKLPLYIPEIKKLETGLNISTRPSAFNLSLIVEFEDKNALEHYQIHPKHKDVLHYMSELKLETAVVDYIK